MDLLGYRTIDEIWEYQFDAPISSFLATPGVAFRQSPFWRSLPKNPIGSGNLSVIPVS